MLRHSPRPATLDLSSFALQALSFTGHSSQKGSAVVSGPAPSQLGLGHQHLLQSRVNSPLRMENPHFTRATVELLDHPLRPLLSNHLYQTYLREAVREGPVRTQTVLWALLTCGSPWTAGSPCSARGCPQHRQAHRKNNLH